MNSISTLETDHQNLSRDAATLKKRIYGSIFKSIDRINELRSPERRIRKEPQTVLLGLHGSLDSLDLVNLIINTEQFITAEFGENIILTDIQAIDRENSPFTTVGSLAEYILEKLNV